MEKIVRCDVSYDVTVIRYDINGIHGQRESVKSNIFRIDAFLNKVKNFYHFLL